MSGPIWEYTDSRVFMMNPFVRLGRFIRRLPSPPRTPSTSNSPILDSATKVEEERMPAYDRGLFSRSNLVKFSKPDTKWSVYWGTEQTRRFGFVVTFGKAYLWLSTCGVGGSWLSRHYRYIALKIFIGSHSENQEVRVLDHLSNIRSNHPGSSLVRKMIDKFELTGPRGVKQCIVYEPLLTSLLHFQAILDPKSLPEDLLKGALQQLLLALDYLNSEARVIHTGLWIVRKLTVNKC